MGPGAALTLREQMREAGHFLEDSESRSELSSFPSSSALIAVREFCIDRLQLATEKVV
jgi:phage tail tape-measure protein